MSPDAGSRPRVPLHFELLYCLSLLSVLLYSFDAGHIGLPAVVTCFEWKAGPPSSLPFSALVPHPAVALSRRDFFIKLSTCWNRVQLVQWSCQRRRDAFLNLEHAFQFFD